MKKNVLYISLTLLSIFLVTILLPSALVAIWPADDKGDDSIVQLQVKEDEYPIKVYLKAEKKTVTMPIEQYVRGVVAAEMPVRFENEALKAQAVAARTYIVRKMQLGAKTPEGADVSDDHTEAQAFKMDDKLKEQWGADYAQNISKINEAVNETKGKIAMYEGKPIEALFFSTSSGFTENSEDYWGKQIPYLRSVKSPWDEKSDKFTAKQDIPLVQFYEKLGIKAVAATAGDALIEPIERSVTDHIKKLRVGGKEFTGAEFRTLTGLRSTLFTWKVAGDTITFFTKGYGHGVGLSQYGANGMAAEGKKADEILRYYYQGIALGDVKQVLPKP
jgi:stage II sporulation protein D